MKCAHSLQYLKASTKRKAHLAEIILREIGQDAAVNPIPVEYPRPSFEAKGSCSHLRCPTTGLPHGKDDGSGSDLLSRQIVMGPLC